MNMLIEITMYMNYCKPGCDSALLIFLVVALSTNVAVIDVAGMIIDCAMLHSIFLYTLRPRQNGHHFADDTLKRIFLNQNVRNSIDISLKFVPKGPINSILALVLIMAWRRSGDKPLSEPMSDSLLTHICVTRPQWVKRLEYAHSANTVNMIITYTLLHFMIKHLKMYSKIPGEISYYASNIHLSYIIYIHMVVCIYMEV